MSLPREIISECPKCGHPQNVTIWSSFNAEIEGEAATERFKTGEFFVCKCEKCASVAILNYSCLYNDTPNKFMIYLMPRDNEKWNEQIAEYRTNAKAIIEMNVQMGFTTRIVGNVQELIEKINIFEAGYDDRVIEIYKLFVLRQAKVELSELQFGKGVYVRQKGEPDAICLPTLDGRELTFPFPPEAYDVCSKPFAEVFAQNKPAAYDVIDSAWASDVLSGLG